MFDALAVTGSAQQSVCEDISGKQPLGHFLNKRSKKNPSMYCTSLTKQVNLLFEKGMTTQPR